MNEVYTAEEFEAIRSRVDPRTGWDFSSIRDSRASTSWDYLHVAREHLSRDASVLDVGTGGGERLIELATDFRTGLGVDVDPDMVQVAQHNGAGVPNVKFAVDDASLRHTSGLFDVVLNRHVPYNLSAVATHLSPDGWFITQQVGEQNMRNVKQALGQAIVDRTINEATTSETPGLEVVTFDEYEVGYVVHDIDSLVFWLGALDMLHADLPGADVLASVNVLNQILAGNVDDRGFVTNEHRYLVVARRSSE